jgi:lipoprotein-releasing system ATP-binding protein
MTVILKAKKLHKTFLTPTPLQVLAGVDLEAVRGEAIAIMGKSGEGKSTLLQILGTLEKPCEGEIEICGNSFRTTPLDQLRNRHIGFIFQGFNLLEDYSVLDNVLMPARIGRKKPSPERALKLLEQVGLAPRANFLAKLLSGGEKQRVAIARALCNDPDLILADEPTGNLDYATSQTIHELLLYTVRSLNKTLIVVTHDRELAALCDRTLILKEGKLCAS